MRTILLFAVFTTNLVLIARSASSAVIIPSTKQIVLPETLKVRDVQKMLGRKLTFKEKISFLVFRHQLKDRAGTKKSSGQTALMLGILSLALLLGSLFFAPLLFGSLAGGILSLVLGNSARQDNPSDKKAKAAILLGWITLGLLALIFLILVIVMTGYPKTV